MVRQALVKKADPGRALDVGGNGIHGLPFLRGADDGLGQAALDLVLLHRRRARRRRRCGFGLFCRLLLFPIEPQRLGPTQKLLGRLSAINFIDPVNDLFAIRQRKSMTTAGALGRGFDSVAFDRLGPKTHRRVRVGFCLFDCLFNRKIHRLQVVAVRHRNHVPSQRAHR